MLDVKDVKGQLREAELVEAEAQAEIQLTDTQLEEVADEELQLISSPSTLI
jgi:hypothetical protein